MARAGKDQQDKAKAESKKKAEQAKSPMNELVKVLEQNTKTMNKLLTGLNSLTRDSLAKQPSQKSPEEIEKAQLQNALMKENLKHKQLENERYEKENKIKAKEASRNDYKENIVYRAGANIAGQKSSTMASLALSTLTGGIINPVIAKSFGLDKLFSAGFNATGRVLGHTSNMAYRGVKSGVGALGRGIKNIFTGDDEIQKETSGSKPSKGKSRKRDSSAVASDKNKATVEIAKDVKDIKTTLTSRTKQTPKVEEKKDEGLFGKMFQAIGGIGGVLKGVALAALPKVIDVFAPKALEWVDNKFKDVLSMTGMSDESADGVDQIVKDALPGALFGFGVAKNPIKGALVGGALSLGYASIKRIIDKFNGISDEDDKESSIMGIPSSYFEAAIAGATLGSAKGITGMAIGAGLGAAAVGLSGFAGNIEQQFNDWMNDKADFPAESAMMIGAITGGALGWKIAGAKGALIGIALGTAGPLLYGLGEKLGEWAANLVNWANESWQNLKKKGITGIIKDMAIGIKDWATGNTEETENSYNDGSNSLVNMTAANIAQEKTQTPISEDLDYKSMPKDLGYTPMPDNQGGGYGSFNTSNMSDDVVIHNRQAKAMKSMGLSGSIASINSIPFVAEQNEESLKNLDGALKSWGYEVVYTSAMGGHRPGTGHWKGNKVDLQLKKNGQPTHLANHQLQALRKAGYWGSGTGALGWEPVSGQVGGGHYDLFLGHGGGSINTSETKYADAGGRAGNTVERMESQSASTSEDMMSMNMAEINGNLQASLSRPSGGASSSPVAAAMNDTMPFTSGSAGPISMPSSDNFNLSGLGSMGGASAGPNNKTGTVYAYGDVAKTAILHTT